MGLIGQSWKHRKMCRRLVLIYQQTTNILLKTKQQQYHRVHYAVSNTTPTPTNNLLFQKIRVGGHSIGDTPGPIPNPEAKPKHADGTAPGRVWESKSPPTLKLQKNKKRGPHRTHPVRAPFFAYPPAHALTKKSPKATITIRQTHGYQSNTMKGVSPEALEHALTTAGRIHGNQLIHHSDRGS